MYQGEFIGDKRDGEGTLNLASGARYVGDWKVDMRNGHGV